MAEIVSADHIAAEGGGYEPQRKNNFTVRFTPPNGIKGEEVISLSLRSVPFPTEDTAAVEVHFGNEKRSVAGKTEFTEEELVCHDYVDGEVESVIRDWRKRVYDATTGKVGYAVNYKREGELVWFGPDGTHERRWRLIGMWPRTVKYGEGDMTSTDANQISVTFRVDKILREV